jgi:NitT/TauT family transport system ATP-binding protein
VSVPTLPPDAMAVDGTSFLRLEGLTQSFVRSDGSPVTALDGIDLTVDAGQFVSIIGPSGCGKTTLMNAVAGLVAPTSGTIETRHGPVTGPGPDRGVVFQKDTVFPWMRVRDNVSYGLRVRGESKARQRELTAHFLAEVGLEHVADSWPRELSGGMLKRVAVATVFANGSDVLLLDEPFGALDYVTKRQLHQVLLRLWGEGDRRRTVLFVTHDVDEALILSDRILVLGGGHVVEDLHLDLPRPRDSEVLATAEALKIKSDLLGHLGIAEDHHSRSMRQEPGS